MGVQGRFGRQEDWRKVERQQASRKLTLREQVELEAAEQRRMSREAAERREAEMQRRRQVARQQAAEGAPSPVSSNSSSEKDAIAASKNSLSKAYREGSGARRPGRGPSARRSSRQPGRRANTTASATCRANSSRTSRQHQQMQQPAASAGAAIHGGAGSSPFPAARSADPDAG